MQQWATSQGYMYPSTLVEQCSSEELLMNRTSLTKLREFIQPGTLILVYDIDYIYTCREDYVQFTEQLDRGNIKLFVLRQNLHNFDPGSNYLLSKCILEIDQKRRLTNAVPLNKEIPIAITQEPKAAPVIAIGSSEYTTRYAGRRCYGYIRVSTKKQADTGLSLECQESSVKRWATRNRCVLVSVEGDRGISGKDLKKLKSLNLLLDKIADSELIIVENVSRLIRSASGYREIMNRLIAKKCGLISIREGLHIHTMDDVLMSEGYVDLAAHEISNISRNIRTVNDYKSGASGFNSTPFEMLMNADPENVRKLLKAMTSFPHRISSNDIYSMLNKFPYDLFKVIMEELANRNCIIAEDDEIVSSEEEYDK